MITEQRYTGLPGRQDYHILEESVGNTPRKSQLIDAGWRTIARGKIRDLPEIFSLTGMFRTSLDHSPDGLPSGPTQPYNTLVKAFSSYGVVDREWFLPITSYLERMSIPEGSVLWKQDDAPDGLYMIESGVLRAVYRFSVHTPAIEESMVAGTIAGELSALSDSSRNATCIVERDAVVWKLSLDNMQRLEEERPDLARTFTKLALKCEFAEVLVPVPL